MSKPLQESLKGIKRWQLFKRLFDDRESIHALRKAIKETPNLKKVELKDEYNYINCNFGWFISANYPGTTANIETLLDAIIHVIAKIESIYINEAMLFKKFSHDDNTAMKVDKSCQTHYVWESWQSWQSWTWKSIDSIMNPNKTSLGSISTKFKWLLIKCYLIKDIDPKIEEKSKLIKSN